MADIIDGKAFAESLRKRIASETARIKSEANVTPGLLRLQKRHLVLPTLVLPTLLVKVKLLEAFTLEQILLKC